jgi:hypothetical protein
VTLKVPSIPVPSLGGKYENWATFANIFSVLLDAQMYCPLKNLIICCGH